MQITSIESFDSIKESLGKRQELVFNCLLKLEYATNNMLSRALKLPINTITPRVMELRKKGLVAESHKSWDAVTKRKCIYWRVNEIQ